MADGGDGFEALFSQEPGFEKIEIEVANPVGKRIGAHFLYQAQSATALLEMANFSGLQLLPLAERNPMHTSTYGTGEAIKAALKLGARQIILGIGGSATNDAGMGMAAALGYQFLNAEGEVLEPSGRAMPLVDKIVCPANKDFANCKITVACDVQNPLFGPAGAAYVYGPQKGAKAHEVQELDAGLRHFAKICERTFAKDLSEVPGAGAAGGIGFGLMHIADAELISGIEIILDYFNIEQQLTDCDLVITGEGKMDQQTLQGKVVAGVAKRAVARQIPVWAICGLCELSDAEINSLGLARVAEIIKTAANKEDAMQNTAKHLDTLLRDLFHSN